MNIQGMQKLTLLDYPQKIACTFFTAGCQLNCGYCHNSELISGPFEEGISIDSVLAFLHKRKSILQGVCISGGEPLLQTDIKGFLKEIKGMGYLIKLDTNGGFPDKLSALVHDHLVDYVAMDIKHSPDKYSFACGIPSLDIAAFEMSKNFLLENHVAYEFRTTLVKPLHTVDDVIAMAKWIKGAKQYFLQNFVASPQVRANQFESFDSSELQTFKEAAQGYITSVEIRGI